jgi:hypothetical protein
LLALVRTVTYKVLQLSRRKCFGRANRFMDWSKVIGRYINAENVCVRKSRTSIAFLSAPYECEPPRSQALEDNF